jgi:hypothetical protein
MALRWQRQSSSKGPAAVFKAPVLCRSAFRCGIQDGQDRGQTVSRFLAKTPSTSSAVGFLASTSVIIARLRCMSSILPCKAVMLIVDLNVLIRVGLWQGLVRPNVLQAVGASVLLILGLPWLVFAVTLGLAPLLYVYGLVLDDALGWCLGGATW